MITNISQKYVLGLSLIVLILTYLLSYDSWDQFFAWKPMLGLGIAVATNILNSINKGTIAEQTTNLVREVKKAEANGVDKGE